MRARDKAQNEINTFDSNYFGWGNWDFNCGGRGAAACVGARLADVPKDGLSWSSLHAVHAGGKIREATACGCYLSAFIGGELRTYEGVSLVQTRIQRRVTSRGDELED